MLLDLPSSRTEGWRWSDLSALPEIAAGAPSGAVPETLPWIDCEAEGPRLLFVDGRLEMERSNLAGITVGTVAVEAGEIVSHVFIHLVEKVPKPGDLDGKWGYVTNVYTRPAFRGRGIGSELMRNVTNWAREIGLELLIVWPSRESVPFYERAGFSPSDEIMELIFQGDA